jgi:hypothetical protein
LLAFFFFKKKAFFMDFLFNSHGLQLEASLSNPALTYLQDNEYQMMLHVDAAPEHVLEIILKVSELANASFKMLGMPLLNGGPERTFMIEIKGDYDFLLNIRQQLGVFQFDQDIDEEQLHAVEIQADNQMVIG